MTVISGASFLHITYQSTGIVIVEVRAIFLIAAAPAPDADHPVVFQPFREGIVGSMNTNETATRFHVLLKSLLSGYRPA